LHAHWAFTLQKYLQRGIVAMTSHTFTLDREWQASNDVGILFSAATNTHKALYSCSKCSYVADRLYHAKMHYQRIHVLNGRAMPRKRKYQAQDVLMPGRTPSKKTVEYLRRSKNAAAARTILGVRKHVTVPHVPKVETKLMSHHATGLEVLSFGDFDVQWTKLSSPDLQVLHSEAASWFLES